MTTRELAFLFPCEGDELVGIVAAPAGNCSETGVLVVVGGPQYRVGSHRQFVLLARDLAAEGIPCMRFDYRGMGDATGAMRQFDAVDADIRAAVDAFFGRVPQLRRVVLWGLCDGASAACFYAPGDPRVSGLILLNPWVRTPAGVARTYLRHYYLKRITTPAFWRKLFSGGLSLGKSLEGLIGAARTAGRAKPPACTTDGDLPKRIAGALWAAGKPFCLILSGKDYVAREFEEAVRTEPALARLAAMRHPERLHQADHTFSDAAWRARVGRLTVDWVTGPATVRNV